MAQPTAVARATPTEYEAHPHLRFTIDEAAKLLRMSRAKLYLRVSAGALRLQKDGGRSYVTRAEIERYVAACDAASGPAAA